MQQKGTLTMNNFYSHINELRGSYSSFDGLYESCKRKYELTKLFQHPTERESNVPGETGKALHAGYQNFLINKDRDKAIEAMMLEYPIDLCADVGDFRSLEACYSTMNAMIDSGAFLEYEIASVHCLDGEIRPAIEVAFKITIKDFSLSDERYIPVIFVGFIDFILYDTVLDEYLVVDIKTTRDNLVDKTNIYRYDNQCIPYALVLERILNRDIHALNSKIFSVYLDIMKPGCKVYSYTRPRADVEDWARGLLVKLHEIKQFYNMGWFPRSAKSCVSFKKPCYFIDICASRDHRNIQNHFLMPGQEPFPVKEIDYWVEMELELAA